MTSFEKNANNTVLLKLGQVLTTKGKNSQGENKDFSQRLVKSRNATL